MAFKISRHLIFEFAAHYYENVCRNLWITAKAICCASHVLFCKLLFIIYTSGRMVSVWIHKVLTFSLSSFTSFFNWSTSILALSKSVRFSTFITGIFCEKTNQMHMFYNSIKYYPTIVKAKLIAEVFTFYMKPVTKSTLTAAYGEFSSPWRQTENLSALSQSRL